MALLFTQVWFLDTDVEEEGIRSRRFLFSPLAELFGDKPDREKDIPEWVSFVALENGIVYYPMKYQESEWRDYTWPNDESSVLTLKEWTATLVDTVPDSETMINFSYRGMKGLCMYKANRLPFFLRILQIPAFLGNLFLLTLFLFALGAVMMNSHHRNVKELIKASVRIRNMDLDTPISSRRVSEMSEVFDAFDKMRLELKDTRRQGALFFMSVTHDLKTPLTAMRGYLEALQDGVIDTREGAMDAIERVLFKAGVLEERINELLHFSKMLSTGWETGEHLVDVNLWIRDLASLFRDECEAKSRNFESETDLPVPLYIKGKALMLTRAMENLLDNACRYTMPDDRIRFSAGVGCDGKFLILVLEDSGPGVDPENREKIFDLFFRKDRGRNTRGMGIGLASVKSLAEDYGGSVFCRESLLGGACFEVRLPIFREPV